MRGFVGFLVLAVLGLGACGGDGSETSTGTSAAVTIVDFAFDPKQLQVAAGETFEVVNRDEAPHTLTAEDRSFDSGNLGEGERASLVIDDPGTYEVLCDIHQYMRGTVVVE